MTPVILALAALAVVYALVAWGSWWRSKRELEMAAEYDRQRGYDRPRAERSKEARAYFADFNRRAEIALRVRDRLGSPGDGEPTFAAVLAEVESLVVAS